MKRLALIVFPLSILLLSFTYVNKEEQDENPKDYYSYFIGERHQCSRTHSVKNLHNSKSITVKVELSCNNWSGNRTVEKTIAPLESEEIECQCYIYADCRIPIRYRLISVSW